MPKQRLTIAQRKAIEILTLYGSADTEYEFHQKKGILLPNKPHIKAVTITALIRKGWLTKVKEINFVSKPGIYNPVSRKWNGAKCHSIAFLKINL